jgi:glycerophosphoryl diester phosphodiesterase
MKRLFSIICIIVLFLTLSISCFAFDEGDIWDRESDYGIIAVSYRGYHKKVPENSKHAVRLAIANEADAVYLNVKFSSDNVAFLCADDNLSRVTDCTDETLIKDMTAEQILSYKTKNGKGGPNAEVTPYKLTALTEVLKDFGRKTTLILDFDFNRFDDVLELCEQNKCQNNVVLVCNTDVKKYNEKLASLEYEPRTILFRKTNIVFTAIGCVNAVNDKENASVWLATSNSYGEVWRKNVTSKFDNSRAVVCTAEFELCGRRNDTESYWNDLVSRGYSVIISDDLKGLVQFRNNSKIAGENLRRTVKDIQENYTLPEYKSYIFLDYKKAFNEYMFTAEKVISNAAIAERDAQELIYNLNQTIDDIDYNYKVFERGVTGIKITVTRVIIAVICIALVVIVQIFFFKRRKKQSNEN